jgi:hypothetical protein
MRSLRFVGIAVFGSIVFAFVGCGDSGSTGGGAQGPTSSSSGTGGPSACLAAKDCSMGLVCSARTCIAAGSVKAGAPCSATRDCMAGLNCTELGVCTQAGSGKLGDPCSGGADCSSGLACVFSGLSGTCTMGGSGDAGDMCKATTDCLAGLVCGANGTCDSAPFAFPPYAGVTCGPDEDPFRAYWEVPRSGKTLADFYRLPFPNDARMKADGTLDLADFPRPGPSILGVDIVDLYANALSQDFDGFASVTSVIFRFSKDLDIKTANSNVHYVDVTDPTAMDFGSERSVYYSYTIQKGKFVCQHPFSISNAPSEPLKPGHKYAAYFTTGLKSTDGTPASPDADLTTILGATMPTDPALAAVWTKYANFRAYLTGGVSVVTVADPVTRARKLAATTVASGLPTLSNLTLCDGMTTSPCDGYGDRHCGNSSGSFWEIHGRFTEPNYQAGMIPYETPANGGAISYDATGNPMSAGTLSICFALTIPKSAAPAGGWPLVVHAHGTGGSFRSAISDGIANTLATGPTPMATFTYDGVAHGARKGTSTRSEDSLVFNVINPRAARDNHAQGAVDVEQALRIAQVAPFMVNGVGNVHFDATKTYFFGHSQGSTMGIPGVAMSPDAKAAIFSGAGSYLIDGILNKTSPTNAKAGLSLLLGESIDAYHPVMGLWQTFFNRIDPLNYDGLIVAAPPMGIPSKHVFMTWSATDTYSPKATLTDTAQVMQLLQAPPVIEMIQPPTTRPVTSTVMAGDGVLRTAAVFQYATDGTYDGHFVSEQNPMAIADWRAFLNSLAATGTPNVP